MSYLGFFGDSGGRRSSRALLRMSEFLRLQVHMSPTRVLPSVIFVQKTCPSTRRCQEPFCWMPFPCARHMCMQHVPECFIMHVFFIHMPHGMRRSSALRFLRSTDFGGSRKARPATPGSRRGDSVACMHHFSCHARCACSMACRAHAYRARARPRSALSPAWQKPARRHRCRTGTPLRMQPMLHAIGSHAE